MFSTCIHCHTSLGHNSIIEELPIGRRIAFDAALGRLWVVCARCRRWNLTPFEDRWEAIESCERQYRLTTLRASTDNIALARLPDGTDLIRIGAPSRPELASWRYARDFRRRWRVRGYPLALLGGGGIQIINYSMGHGHEAVNVAAMYTVFVMLIGVTWVGRRPRVTLPSGKVATLDPILLKRSRVVPSENGWAFQTESYFSSHLIEGPAAVPALRSVMAARNFAGAPSRDVDAAVSHLGQVGDAGEYIRRLARASLRTGIHHYPPDISMALEMALHEDSERRALDGELALLHEEWRAAEEVARISDALLLPAAVESQFDRLKEGR